MDTVQICIELLGYYDYFIPISGGIALLVFPERDKGKDQEGPMLCERMVPEEHRSVEGGLLEVSEVSFGIGNGQKP